MKKCGDCGTAGIIWFLGFIGAAIYFI